MIILSLWKPGSHLRKLFFEHLPKCGGTSMSDYLRRHYPAQATYDVYGARPREIEAFIGFPQVKRHAYEFILGHGVQPLLDHCDPRIVPVTILREPVARIVSHYYFVKATPDHYLHQRVLADEMTLRDYAASDLSTELRNDMVRRFLGMMGGKVEAEPQAALEAAWEVLQDRYRVVGVLERLVPAMAAIREVAGLSTPWSDRRVNRTKGKVPMEKISAEDRRVIEERNALDIELYRRVEAVAPR